MAAVFRTLVSSQDPVKPLTNKPTPFWKKDAGTDTPPNNAPIETDEHVTSPTASSTASPQASARKRFNIFRRRKHGRKKMQNHPEPELEPEQEPEPETSGLEVTRDPAADAPMYFNHPLQAVQPREAYKRGNRESYAAELQNLIRGTTQPADDDDADAIQEIPRAGDDVTSPKSFFDDDSSDGEEEPAPRKGKGMKKSLSDLKVSTSNFLSTRSQAYGGRLGSGGMAGGSGTGLGIGEIEQTKKSPVISSPTDFRRLNSASEWPDFSEGSKSRSPSLAKSPSTPTIATGRSQKGRLGKMPSTSNLWDGFWGKAQEASPTKQHPSDAETVAPAELRGRTPAYLARAQRRHQAALPMIAERPAAPSPPPRDAAARSTSPVSSSSSFYVEDAEPSALPAPLNVVKRPERQQQQTLPARRGADGKIERSPSFLRRIQELGDERRRLQTSVSHPTLRNRDPEAETIVRSTPGPASTENLQQGQQQILLDDAPPVPPLPATAPLPQRPFAPRRASFERRVQNFWSPSDPYLTPERALRNRLVGNAFMQQLRRDDFGLEPLQKAEKGAANKHPKHPLKWDSENLMCIGKHNAADIAGAVPEGVIEREKPTNMSAVSLPKPRLLKSKASTTSFTSAKNLDSQIIAEAKKCALCGRFCCHFIELLNYLHSPANTTSPAKNTGNNAGYADIADERNRIHASAKVMRLKQEHPNGLDPYDTFVTCNECGKEVCARCARKCGEELCGVVFCEECGDCGHEG